MFSQKMLQKSCNRESNWIHYNHEDSDKPKFNKEVDVSFDPF